MKKFLILALAVVLAGAVQAEGHYNRVFAGYATLSTAGDDFENVHGTFPGLKIGYLHGFGLTKAMPLFLELGGEIQYNHKTNNDPKGRDIYNMHRVASLTIPVSVTYKYGFGPGFYVAPYAGINVRINVISKTRRESHDYVSGSDITCYNWFNEDDMRDLSTLDTGSVDAAMDGNRFQFGGQFGLNFGYKFINLNIGYQLNSTFLKRTQDGKDLSLRTNTFTVGAGFTF